MERKLHYKLHKVKKQWVTIAVASAGLASVVGAAGQTVSADQLTAVEPEASQQEASQGETVAQTTEVAQTATSELPPQKQIIRALQQQAKAAQNQASTAVSESQAQTLSSEQAQPSSSFAVVTQVEADQESSALQSETAQANQGPMDSYAIVSRDDQAKEQVAGASASTEEHQVQVDLAQVQPQNDTQAQAQRMTVTSYTTQEEAAALSLEQIKKVNGKYYYVLDDGSYKKNFAITVDGQMLYFDAETGALTSTSTFSFSQELTPLVSDFSVNNRAFDSQESSFELVDGYLTADSWYRPAMILQNGTDWVASQASDMRPVLMAWWPNKDTQVAYLNFMTEYLGGDSQTFTTETSQLALNTAAELIQRQIEQGITSQQRTTWLREAIAAFVSKQSQWNSESEDFNKKDHLQGGALLYTNNKLTEWADSRYRLLNRTPTYQTGQTKYFLADTYGGYEFLLANDVDTSNPVVQAEMLNQIHYLMNWGSIVMGDDQANFDGIRVDAVDNVNADLLQLYTNYFNSVYGVNESEAKALAHISILEAWSYNDNDYNQDTKGAALAMDNGLRLSLLYSLTRPLDERSGGMDNLLKSQYGLTDRTEDKAYGDTQASYVFVRAHDSEVQTVIAKIIQEKIDPTTDGFTFTLDQLAQAFEIYNKDMNSVDKVYTHYNIPAAYALMLSNMESVTRVYYGDLYTDNGQYMETKSPYYDAIDTLMRARIRYAAGGQTMDLKAYKPAASMSTDNTQQALNNTQVLVSVRYGQDIMSADDTKGGDLAKTSGMVTIVSNNPNLQLAADEQIKVNVGKIHAGQTYRPLLLTTENGLQKYLNDSDTSLTKVADKDGYLTLTADEIKGYKQVEVNGYLAVWVPVGAKADQDIRVAPSTQAYGADDQTFQATQALESQLIYEGFSNFQDFVKTDSQYTNKIIAQNVNLFKEWGVTSFEMAPQYVSADDGTFLDSIIENGYAFKDRYDLAMSKNNKYGSKEDLANALKALHSVGIQAIADWVPDQIYQLPGKEVVTATRVDNYGRTKTDQALVKKLYVANTKSSGEDYQAQYGGEFLAELKEKYPEMFTATMISTGKPIDDSIKLKQWSAQYFNGTNVLGRGAEYVLSDNGTGQYFTVSTDGQFLPAALTGDRDAKTGFYKDDKGMTYYTTSGNKAKLAFISEGGHLYYFDQNGYMVTGRKFYLDSKTYYALANGIVLQDAILEEDGKSYYFGKTGAMYAGDKWYEVQDQAGNTRYRYVDRDGVMAVGLTQIHGSYQYYDANGYQVKGEFITDTQGQTRYFDENSGNMKVNTFFMVGDSWYYADANGILAKGETKVNSQVLYFDKETGAQVKGQFVTDEQGRTAYYASDSGSKQISGFFTTGQNAWYYADANGVLAKGQQTINGQVLYFDEKTGQQVKGKFVTDSKGTRFYDADSGALVVNAFLEKSTNSNEWFYMGSDGYAVKGEHTYQNQSLYFDETSGKQAKGVLIAARDGHKYFYDYNSGERIRNRFVQVNSQWYYFGSNGAALQGFHDINGQHLYFHADGHQAKGETVEVGAYKYTFDKDSGEVTAVSYSR